MDTNATSAPTHAAAVRDESALLLVLSRELAAIDSLTMLRTRLAGRLTPYLPSRDICVVRAALGGWEAIVGPDDGPQRIRDYAWTPLLADGKTIGMLGVGAPAPGGLGGNAAETATFMLAVVAQHVIALDNLRHDIVRDGLTGCFTRAHALEVIEGNLRRASRTGFPLSVMMIDVDGFKQINDTYGHVAGDAVLAAVATQLNGMLRRSDVRCRFGGDEFLVVLPDTLQDDAVRVAESVRQAIEGLSVRSARGLISITASIGVATSTCGAAIDVPGFIDGADMALYRAKEAGRNCVRAAATAAGSPRASQSVLRLATRPA